MHQKVSIDSTLWKKAAAAAAAAQKRVEKNTPMNERYEILAEEIGNQGLEYRDEGEVPAGGAAFGLHRMVGGIRINFRCGYGKHNYAPCLFVFEKQ